jgi:hypothetical protein
MGAQAASYAAGKKAPMPKWARVLVGFGIAAVVGGIYLWLFGFQTGMSLLARYKYGAIPGAQKRPVALPDLSISSVPHPKMSHFGYELEMPWDDIDEAREKNYAQVHISCFHSGNCFWLSVFPPKEFVNEIIKLGNIGPEQFRQMYGDDAVHSDYAFYRVMLNVIPSDISPFMSRSAAARESLLLVQKAIAIPPAESGIYLIETPSLKGFQYEDPKSRPRRISDTLYSDDAGMDVIFFLNRDGITPSISQAEINRVIQSIHKVSISSDEPRANAAKK